MTLTFREQCSYHWLTTMCDLSRAEAMQRIAGERLAEMVEERRNSFPVRDYVKRREAALKGRSPSGRACALRVEPPSASQAEPLVPNAVRS